MSLLDDSRFSPSQGRLGRTTRLVALLALQPGARYRARAAAAVASGLALITQPVGVDADRAGTGLLVELAGSRHGSSLLVRSGASPGPRAVHADLAASVARTLTLGPSFTDDYRRYGPLQKSRHGSDQPLLSGTAGHRGDRTSAQRVAAVCRSWPQVPA